MTGLGKNLNEKKILIIVCCYNEEENIEFCLKSLFESIRNCCNSKSFFVACIDNSSNDLTGEIAKKYCDLNQNFSYIKIKHVPLAISRNSYKLFDENFEYIAYVDADGYVCKQWASTLYDGIESSPDILWGPVLQTRTLPSFYSKIFFSPIPNFTYDLIGANMVFKRSLLENVGGFPTSFYSRGDESTLLLKIKLLRIAAKRKYQVNMVAYNTFPITLLPIIDMFFSDGINSCILSASTDVFLNRFIKLFCHLFILFNLFLSFYFIIDKNINLIFCLLLNLVCCNRDLFKLFFNDVPSPNFSHLPNLLIRALFKSLAIPFFSLGFIYNLLRRSKKINILSEPKTPEQRYND